jgi:RNA polymerase sigma-70 factor, ECF subfamily
MALTGVAFSDPPANATLVARIRAREDEAAAALVQRFGRGVSVILRRVVREKAAVDDLYQDTFRLTIEKIRRGDPRDPDRLPGFVASLARNLAIDHLRRRARRRVEDVEAAEAFADPSPSPLDRLLDRERATLARQVIDGLGSDRDREVLYRFYIAEEDKEVICRQLALTSLHFNRVLHRARQRYRELFEEAVRRTAGGSA